MRGLFVFGFYAATLAVACGGATVASAPPETATIAPATSSATPAPAASSAAPPPARPPAQAQAQATTGPKLCGCALCDPVVSNDACTTDADCAPSTPCHAAACVSRLKAVLRKGDEVCTMSLACASADVNSCGCVKGKCALSPRKQP